MKQKASCIPEDGKLLAEDARNMLQHVKSLSTYHEVQLCEQIQEIRQRWPLLNQVSVDGTVPLPPATKSTSRRTNVVLVTGTAGGVGTTTLVANLAASLHQRGKQVMAVDLSPGQDLHLHLNGLGAQTRDSETKSTIGLLSLDNHDSAQNEQRQPSIDWLASRLPTLIPDSCDWVLIDCPWFLQVAFHQACLVAQQVLLATTTEPAAFSRIAPALASMTSAFQSAVVKTDLLINRYNPAISLQRDIHTLLHSHSPVALVPAEIPYDSRVADSLGKGHSLLHQYHECEATQSFHSLGSWLTSQITSHKESTA